MLCTVESRYLQIYRIEMGKINKIYSINHTIYEIRDHINTSSICYYGREYIYIVAKKNVYKINVSNNALEQVKLDGVIQPGGTLTIDAYFFYFLVGKS